MALRYTRSVLVLAVDTSGSLASVAVGSDDEVLALAGLRTPRPSRSLVPLIGELLRALEIPSSSIEGYAVAVGPGSFTGLRVGMAAAAAMAFAHGRPIVGIGTLDALAWAARAHPAPLCPFLDARRGRVYAALYALEEGRPVRTGPEQDADPLEFLRALAYPVTLLGDGVRAHKEAVAEAAPEGSLVIEDEPLLARAVLQLAAPALREGRGVEAGALRPRYVRPPDARLPGGAPRG